MRSTLRSGDIIQTWDTYLYWYPRKITKVINIHIVEVMTLRGLFYTVPNNTNFYHTYNTILMDVVSNKYKRVLFEKHVKQYKKLQMAKSKPHFNKLT